MPTPTTETSIVLNAQKVHLGKLASYFSFFLILFLLSLIEIKKAKRKCKKEKQKKRKTIQQGGVEFTLTEYLSKADLPDPHYSPASQSVREMALDVGH